MTDDKAEQAIGIFDSGAGGLTVASAVKQLLPEEQIIYFGDTAHLPYGDKSPQTVKQYALRITDYLLEKKCKLILIACNTASAAAFDTLTEYVGERAEVMNVIDPAADFVAQNPKFNSIGVIGTKGTISSGIYEKKIKEKAPQKTISSLATPLLVPLIEEGFIFDDISNAVIRKYLDIPKFKKIDSLILACTHYPIIKNQIRKFFDFETSVVDSSQVVAQRLKELLTIKKLRARQLKNEHEFYLSDYTPYFKKLAEMFFESEIRIRKKYLSADS